MDSEADSVYRFTALPTFDELFLMHLIVKNPLLVTALPFTVHYNVHDGGDLDEIQIKPLKITSSERRLDEFPQEFMNKSLMKHRFLVVTVQCKYRTGGHSMAILIDNKDRKVYFIDPTNSRDNFDRIVDDETAPLVETANKQLHSVLKKLFQDKGFFLTDKQAADKNGSLLYTIVSLVHVLYECNLFVEGSREAVNQKFGNHVNDIRYCIVLTHAVIFAITTYIPAIEKIESGPWRWSVSKAKRLCIFHFIKHFICHPRFDTAEALADKEYMKFLRGHTDAVKALPTVCEDFAISVIGVSHLQRREEGDEDVSRLARLKSKALKERLAAGGHLHHFSRKEFLDKLRIDFDANCLLSTNPWKMLMELPREVIVNFAGKKYGRNVLQDTITRLGHRPFELFQRLGLKVSLHDITTSEGWLNRRAMDEFLWRPHTGVLTEDEAKTRQVIITELQKMKKLWTNYMNEKVRNDLAKEIAKQS
jgi:hypothetical protein